MTYVTKSTNDQVIHNRTHFNRAIIFQGASSVGGFTDIDAAYDVKGKALVLIEVKRHGKQITKGQSILFDRLVSWCQKPVYAITAWENDEGDISLKDCEVVEIRMKDRNGAAVVKPFKGQTVKQIIAYIEKRHGVSQ